MSVKQDVKTIGSKSVSVPVSAAALTVTAVAKVMGVAESVIKAAPSCGMAVALLPFSATKGYLVQEGVAEDVAEQRAYRYVRQELAVTIPPLGEGSGKLLADLMKDEPA